MESEFEPEEPLSEAAAKRLKLLRLLAAVTSPRIAVRYEITDPELIESSVSELEAFAEAQCSNVRFVEDLPEFEDALQRKTRELVRAFHPDPDDDVLKAATDALIAVVPIRAQIVEQFERPFVGVNLAVRLSGIVTSWMAKAQGQCIPQDRLLPVHRNIQSLLVYCQFSVAALADESDVSKASIHRWVKGETVPEKDQLKKIALAFSGKLQVPITVADLRSEDLIDRLKQRLHRPRAGAGDSI